MLTIIIFRLVIIVVIIIKVFILQNIKEESLTNFQSQNSDMFIFHQLV